MKCEICNEELVGCGMVTKTLVGYPKMPDDDPKCDHDDNCINQSYSCKNGHRKYFSLRRKCLNCDWVGKEDCSCHDEKKFDEWP